MAIAKHLLGHSVQADKLHKIHNTLVHLHITLTVHPFLVTNENEIPLHFLFFGLQEGVT